MRFNNKEDFDKKAFEITVPLYFFTCGILSNDDINAICKHHNIWISEKEKKTILKEMDIYNDGEHYSQYSLSEKKKLLNERKNLKLRLLTEDEVHDYLLCVGDILEKLKDAVGEDAASLAFVLNAASKIFDDALYGCSLFKDSKRLKQFKEANIDKKDIQKIIDIFKEDGYNFRYWCYYGRNEDDIALDNTVHNTLLVKKPKEETLLNCLHNLDCNGYKSILETYHFDDKSAEELKEIIIEFFKEDIYSFYQSEYNNYLNCNHKELSYEFMNEDFLHGFVFAYKEDDIIKTIVPKEMIDILKEINVNDLEDNSREDSYNGTLKKIHNLSIMNIIIGYVRMNGVINKKVLKRLLKNNHDIELTLDEIDNIVKQTCDELIHNDCYTMIYDDKIIDDLLSIKGNDYRKFTPEIQKIIDDYACEIKYVCNGNKELAYFIDTITRFGGIEKNYLKNIKEQFNISNSSFNKICEVVNKYKNKLPLWPCNGYTNISNSSTVRNKKKIGRNEPCPCGSGKKYKQCCGK